MSSPDVYTAETVTFTRGTVAGWPAVYLPGGAVVRGCKGAAWECQRCDARSAAGLRWDVPDDVVAFRSFLALHAGAECPPPAPTPKRTRSS